MFRRRLIFEKVVVEMEYKLFYVESICDDPSIIESNIRVSPVVYFQHFELNAKQNQYVQVSVLIFIMIFENALLHIPYLSHHLRNKNQGGLKSCSVMLSYEMLRHMRLKKCKS